MLGTIGWIVVGVIIGWNLPQPKWAAAVQSRVITWVKGLG